MYKVIKHFCDLQDKNHSYNEGDIFPREGLEVSEERLAELAGNKNRQGRPLIEFVEEPAVEIAPAQPEEQVAEEVPAEKPVKKGTKKAAEK